MDLETYIARYSGETRLQRLLLIAQQCPDEAVATQAFHLAEAQMKEDGNLRQYKKVFGLSDNNTSGGEASGDMAMEFLGESNKSSEGNLRRPPPSSATPDEAWMAETESTNKDARHVLQGRLSASQSQMHREAIRNAYVALAKHDAKTGNSSAALASLFRAMDYCTSRTQSGQLSLVLLEVALNSGCYVQTREYVTKLEHTLQGNAATSAEGTEILQDVAIKLQIASGLERMAQGDYATAATTFIKLCKNYGGAASKLEWPTVASADDIALYAALLALATQGRNQILELAEHPEALELVPAMKELLLQWAKANYVKSIQAFSPEGTLLDFPDLYLSANDVKWEKLCQSIREKCLLEYLKPYQCVQLEHMSKLFPSIENIQDTLVDLMGRGLLEGAKIDGRANILKKTSTAANSNPAIPTLKELGQMENRILDDAHAMLIRLACLEQDLCVSDGMGGGGIGSSRRRAAAYGRDHMVEDDDDSSDDEPMMDADLQAAAAAQNPEDLY